FTACDGRRERQTNGGTDLTDDEREATTHDFRSSSVRSVCPFVCRSLCTVRCARPIQFGGRRAAPGVGRTAGSRPCPAAGKSRVPPALSPPRRVTAVPKVYHQRHWAWGGPRATDHDWKNAPR